MSGTTPTGGSGDDSTNDPYAQPTGRPSQPPSWEQSGPPAWEPGSSAADEYGQSAPAQATPRPILTAAKLMYIGAALSLIGGIFALLGRDAVRDEAARATPDATAEEIDSFVTAFIGFMVVIAVLSVALWLWMAAANKKGKNWARITATVLGGLNILFGLWGLTTGGFDASTVVNLISPVLAGVILYLLYRPESTEFYRASSAPKF